MHSKVTRDGSKNVICVVNGEGESEEVVVLAPFSLQGSPSEIKLDKIVYAIEGGTKVRIGWSEDGMLIPLEGRGVLDYYSFESLQPSTRGQSIWVSVTGDGAYHLVLDCSKMSH